MTNRPLASDRTNYGGDDAKESPDATYPYPIAATPQSENTLQVETTDSSSSDQDSNASESGEEPLIREKPLISLRKASVKLSSDKDSNASENYGRLSVYEKPLVSPRNANGPSMRQRKRSRKQKSTPDDAENDLRRAPSERSLLYKMRADIRRLPNATYHYWKWLVFIYLLWMLISHLTTAAYVSVMEQFEPICSLPWIGPKLPLCPDQVKASTKPVNVSRLSASHHQLETVMDSAGKGQGLAMDMLHNEYAIRDLSIRVKHSDLSRKDDLGKELDQLIRLTTRTSDGLSDFTSRVASVTDSIIAFDRFAVRNLRAISDRQENPGSLSQNIISALSPFSAFEPRYKTELELKDVFIRTTSQMASRLPNLIEEAGHLRYLLRRISDVLDQIKGLTIDEIRDSPEMAVLAELWIRVARRDDYQEYKSHQTLLNDITAYYTNAMEVMKETLHALNKMRSDLNEFRDIHVSPALVWRDVPLEVTIEMMSNSMRRLELGRKKLDGYEEVPELPASGSQNTLKVEHD